MSSSSTAYTFLVVSDDDPAIRRTLEMRGDCDLGQLHRLIEREFRLDDDLCKARGLPGEVLRSN